MKRKINGILAIGITGTVIFGSFFAADYIEAMWGKKDIWWTPISLALPLNETRQDLELYIKGELLQRHLEKGTLIGVGTEGRSSPVMSQDIKVRLNNWNKIKASKLNHAVYYAFISGVSLALLIMGLIQFLKSEAQSPKQ